MILFQFATSTSTIYDFSEQIFIINYHYCDFE
jgi:hypothetical protein